MHKNTRQILVHFLYSNFKIMLNGFIFNSNNIANAVSTFYIKSEAKKKIGHEHSEEAKSKCLIIYRPFILQVIFEFSRQFFFRIRF